jgi:hypothetical protein
MEWHFGFNCKYYIPTLKKCQILVREYVKRNELTELKSLNIEEIMAYLDIDGADLIKEVLEGKIKTSIQKDGKINFQIISAWQWDDCPLSNYGGQCLYFESHDGEKISCLSDLKSITMKHPNMNKFKKDEIKYIENKILENILDYKS